MGMYRPKCSRQRVRDNRVRGGRFSKGRKKADSAEPDECSLIGVDGEFNPKPISES